MATIKVTPESSSGGPSGNPVPVEETPILDHLEMATIWLKDNFNKVAYLAAIVGVVWIGYIVWGQQKEKNILAANDLLFDAETALATAIGTAPWGSADRAAKAQEAIAAADKTIAEFSGTEVARRALLLKGDAYFNMGDDASSGAAPNTLKAIEIYEEFLRTATTEEDKATANLALGYAYENKFFLLKDGSAFEPSIANYEKVRSNPAAGFLKYEAMNAIARMYEFQGKTQEATQLYLEVYKARYRPEPSMEDLGGNQNKFMVSQLRNLAQAFTVGHTARTALLKLGVDVEAMEAKK